MSLQELHRGAPESQGARGTQTVSLDVSVTTFLQVSWGSDAWRHAGVPLHVFTWVWRLLIQFWLCHLGLFLHLLLVSSSQPDYARSLRSIWGYESSLVFTYRTSVHWVPKGAASLSGLLRARTANHVTDFHWAFMMIWFEMLIKISFFLSRWQFARCFRNGAP